MIKEGIYNILLVSTELLNQKLERDLFPIGQMIKEAKPLLNSAYLNSISITITKDNVKWYIDTTESKLKIIEKIINSAKAKDKKYSLLIQKQPGAKDHHYIVKVNGKTKAEFNLNADKKINLSF